MFDYCQVLFYSDNLTVVFSQYLPTIIGIFNVIYCVILLLFHKGIILSNIEFISHYDLCIVDY